ncbi:MAG: Trk family potassium uptake protein [Clostridia bacterium]|nr:Trk family potassium uptake protein [Clostridia bacterium]
MFKTVAPKKGLNSFQVIILGFISLIFVGALLLCLPISSNSGEWTSFADCVFTAVSATCVTGLVVLDTATHWSLFGQFIILIMIQIGGMGVITVGIALIKLSGKKIGLLQRNTMQSSISAPQTNDIIKFTGFILKASGITELAGAVALAPVFCKDFGFFKGIWYAVWHSVSAFCNAGFDLMGVKSQFSSLTAYSFNGYMNSVIMILITVGGIGFLVWKDVTTNKFNLKKYSLQSKIVLTTSLILVLLPATYFFIFEYASEPFKERLFASLFQSVTTRTAGFNTKDLALMSEPGQLLMIFLMLVGGSPGSTAGGMKTVTLAVLILSAIAVFARKKDIQCFNRRLPENAVGTAGAILSIYLTLFLLSGVTISIIEGLPILTCLFETSSAIGTVGLSLGITPSLSIASKIILMALMFFGRVGALTLIYAAVPQTNSNSRLPLENVAVG